MSLLAAVVTGATSHRRCVFWASKVLKHSGSSDVSVLGIMGRRSRAMGKNSWKA